METDGEKVGCGGRKTGDATSEVYKRAVLSRDAHNITSEFEFFVAGLIHS